MDLVTAEMVASMSSIRLEDAVEETFSGFPLYAAPLVGILRITKDLNSPPKVINRGVEIICGPVTRRSPRVQSRLREILEEAASGSRLDGLSAFSVYFDKLLASAV